MTTTSKKPTRTRSRILLSCGTIAAALLASPAGAEPVRARPAYDFVNSVGVAGHFFWTGSNYQTRFPQL